jgi:hypothetical protein
MNREIKFRAWQSKEKKMYIQGDTVDENRKVFWDIWENKSHISEPMQYTGLKDKSGKEGYHKDFVKRGKRIYTIEWQNEEGRFWLAPYNHPGTWRFMDELSIMEIVGNIYETPELLNQGTKSTSE